MNLVSRKVERLKIDAVGNRTDTNYVAFVEIEKKNGFEVEFLSLSFDVERREFGFHINFNFLMESNQDESHIRMGQRNVYCHQCEKQDNYMVNLNEVKCKFCGSPAVEFTAKSDIKNAKSQE